MILPNDHEKLPFSSYVKGELHRLHDNHIRAGHNYFLCLMTTGTEQSAMTAAYPVSVEGVQTTQKFHRYAFSLLVLPLNTDEFPIPLCLDTAADRYFDVSKQPLHVEVDGILTKVIEAYISASYPGWDDELAQLTGTDKPSE